jgi:hypothetical protein
MLAETTRRSHPHGNTPVPSSWQMTRVEPDRAPLCSVSTAWGSTARVPDDQRWQMGG